MIAALDNVFKSWRTSPEAPEQRVLEGVDLRIEAGETLAITGPSGCGKSTLLNLLGTLDVPDKGSVTIFGKNPAELSEAALSDLRADHIGFIFQLHHLLPHLTAVENVMIPALAGSRRLPRKEAEARATHLLERVGLSAHAKKKPAQLSGGERQRVAVVRALLRRPGLVLADEPTGALDAAGAASLMDLLLELHRESESGAAMVLVSHDAGLAARMARQYRLQQGKLIPG